MWVSAVEAALTGRSSDNIEADGWSSKEWCCNCCSDDRRVVKLARKTNFCGRLFWELHERLFWLYGDVTTTAAECLKGGGGSALIDDGGRLAPILCNVIISGCCWLTRRLLVPLLTRWQCVPWWWWLCRWPGNRTRHEEFFPAVQV